MCMSKPKAPKAAPPQTPPPPPPPAPEAPPQSPALNADTAAQRNSDANTKARRTGTQSLRIDLNLGGGGTGLNIPA